MRGRRGPVLPVLLVVLLASVLAACASKPKQHPAQGVPSAPGTSSVTFHAFDSNGDLAVRVGDVVRGECWTTSVAAPVAGAYRCFEGNKILDPCFAPAHATAPVELACMATPWSEALMLRVTGPLPAPAAGDLPSRPWAFQFDNGLRCVASTGTVPEVAGVNLGYYCTDGGHAALADNAGAMVTAQYAAPGAGALQTMTVTTIWHA